MFGDDKALPIPAKVPVLVSMPKRFCVCWPTSFPVMPSIARFPRIPAGPSAPVTTPFTSVANGLLTAKSTRFVRFPTRPVTALPAADAASPTVDVNDGAAGAAGAAEATVVAFPIVGAAATAVEGVDDFPAASAMAAAILADSLNSLAALGVESDLLPPRAVPMFADMPPGRPTLMDGVAPDSTDLSMPVFTVPVFWVFGLRAIDGVLDFVPTPCAASASPISLLP